jgi:uncharacterized protein (TIGR03435 family)
MFSKASRIRVKALRVCAVGALGVCALFEMAPLCRAQTATSAQTTTLTFDVASIRQNLAGDDAQGADQPHVNFPIGSDDAYYDTGGVFSAINLPLSSYLIFAFKITNNNRQALMDSVPEWVRTNHYNIEARTDLKTVTKDQMRLMMQALLKDRFNLQVHQETRDVRVYAAELNRAGKLGPQLRVHPEDMECPKDGPNPTPESRQTTPSYRFDTLGFPEVCGGFVNSIKANSPYDRRVGGGGLPLSRIVASFNGLGDLGRPVVDHTGLVGKYDFFLEFLPDPSPGKQTPADADGPNFIEALKTQLGIKLTPDKAPIDFVLIDHIDKPTPN